MQNYRTQNIKHHHSWLIFVIVSVHTWYKNGRSVSKAISVLGPNQSPLDNPYGPQVSSSDSAS